MIHPWKHNHEIFFKVTLNHHLPFGEKASKVIKLNIYTRDR